MARPLRARDRRRGISRCDSSPEFGQNSTKRDEESGGFVLGVFRNDRKTPTGLDQYVNGVNKALTLTGRSKMHACIIVGVAFDYCVRFTAEDARLYFERVVVLENATRAVGLGDCAL